MKPLTRAMPGVLSCKLIYMQNDARSVTEADSRQKYNEKPPAQISLVTGGFPYEQNN